MSNRILGVLGAAVLVGASLMGNAIAQEPLKKASTLYPPEIVARVRANVESETWASNARDQIIAAAQPWLDMDDDALWGLMFGPTITRSWMVWSNGYCPACNQSVPMYTWKMSALDTPWKTRCPHCDALFPTNDFAAFYRSGLDGRGVFDPAKADRSLLFNTEHPDPADPLHLFGVDDGEGYVDGDKRWRFVGAYLVYGQWKQAVIAGIRSLAAAHVLTGDPAYARKAAILLDRVADLYPEFDFGAQASLYERKADRGYVSTWHDACEETREMVMAYDMIFEAIREDQQLVGFLSQKAAQYGLENPKATFLDIQRNIENRILRDALANRPKITTNYPRTELAVAIILATLGWEENQAAFWEVVDPMLDKATAVDGVTGEKGLAGYSSYTIQAMAMFIGEFCKVDPEFLNTLLERHPRLRETYRFHIDTHCLGRYYPLVGDTGHFAGAVPQYEGMNFLRLGVAGATSSAWTFLPPSCYTLLWRLYEQTGDAAYVQTLYQGNDGMLEGLPYDLYAEDAEAVREGVRRVIQNEGTQVRLGNVDKQDWHLAILRSGQGSHRRALWMSYESGGGHGHANALNIGLFSNGLDLLPEFGYPPVQFGGWTSERAVWYTMTAAHNTVVVDGRNAANGAGATTLWAEGNGFSVMRADARATNGGERFERTLALVDLSPEASYVVDIFRVAGGAEHTKFTHSHFGEVTTQGLNLQPAEDYGHGTQMRNFRLDPAPRPGWSADWTISDVYGLLSEKRDLHFRYTDLTAGAAAGLAEAWVVKGGYNADAEAWIPRALVRRRAEGESKLESTFVAVIEPYEGQSAVASIERLPLAGPQGETLGDSHVALLVTLTDGRRDLILARDPEDAAVSETSVNTAKPLQTDADLCFARFNAEGVVEHVSLCNASRFKAGDTTLALEGFCAYSYFDAKS